MVEYQIKNIGGYLIRLNFPDKSIKDLIIEEFTKEKLNILKIEVNRDNFEIIFIKDDFEKYQDTINHILNNITKTIDSTDEHSFIKELNSDINNISQKINNFLIEKYNIIKKEDEEDNG